MYIYGSQCNNVGHATGMEVVYTLADMVFRIWLPAYTSENIRVLLDNQPS